MQKGSVQLGHHVIGVMKPEIYLELCWIYDLISVIQSFIIKSPVCLDF